MRMHRPRRNRPIPHIVRTEDWTRANVRIHWVGNLSRNRSWPLLTTCKQKGKHTERSSRNQRTQMHTDSLLELHKAQNIRKCNIVRGPSRQCASRLIQRSYLTLCAEDTSSA